MKTPFNPLFAAALIVAAGVMSARAADAPASSSYEAEKAKAMANPYANDLGPDKLPADVLATYPKELQDAYNQVLQVKCAKCHTPSRPLNSQFFEPEGKGPEKAAKIAALKKSSPDMFQNKNVLQVEADIWQRYVKRMMAKPGCDISSDQGKAVYKFLVYDSNQRKAGKNKAAWKTHREKLLAEFKQKYPARYIELYEKAPAK
jgi:mono/diheme cytochrome c family protein